MRIFSFIVLVSSILFYSCNETVKPKNGENEKVEVDSLTAYKNAAFEVINEQLKADPNNPNLYMKRAQMYEQYDEVLYAIEDIDRAIKIDSLLPEFYLLKAEMQKKVDDFQNAKRTLDRCLFIDNNNVQARIELGWLAFIIQNYEQAIEYADAALKRNMYSAEAYYLKGMVFYEQQDTTKAISSFITAVEQESNYYDAYIQLGVLHFNQDNDLAKGYIKNALRIKPESPEALYHYGLWCQEHGEYNEAIETYHKIIAIKPFREALFNLGYIHQEYLKVYDLAIGFYTEAIGSDKNYFEAYYNRGLCHEQLGNFDQAELDYRKALEINSNYDFAALSLDRVLKKK
ncbi:tetratricopeptide repeat protein [Vicingus serpentipes]|jgi:tetratricopeptide (TPR) repeat protein|uniref:Tetratricopeptide repeat protein n=1 Tax=Vicingus serpentipes TaxID=1926625 RepID=A0A5C6RWZ0_9FLAO|nr:tetratricopeptide repeat protein [Vicingus serpentipes]TXB66821.1 tetratricopeptide repeat protein [Vicingus serpentipes]